MKIAFILPLLTAALFATATYDSITQYELVGGHKGFKAGVEHIDEKYIGNDIETSKNYAVPQRASLLNMSYEEALKTDLENIEWCTNGMTRLKVYVPAHTEYFSMVFVSKPNNSYLGFATFKPIGASSGTGINDRDAQGKGEIGTDAFAKKLFIEHETVLFKIRDVYSFTIDKKDFNDYGFDFEKGGYFYISLTQAGDVIDAANGYDPRYVLGTSVKIRVKKPFVNDYYIEDLLSVIPQDSTEPYEEVIHEITKECTDKSAKPYAGVSTALLARYPYLTKNRFITEFDTVAETGTPPDSSYPNPFSTVDPTGRTGALPRQPKELRNTTTRQRWDR